MAITFSGVQSTVVAATSVTVTTPTAPGGGALSSVNTIFALVATGGSSSEWAGYAAAGWSRAFWETSQGLRMHALYRQATASEPANYTLGAYTSATIAYGIMFAVAGHNVSNPLDSSPATDAQATNSTTLVCPTMSPSLTNSVLLWTGIGRGNTVGTGTAASSTGTELFDVNGGTTDASRGVMAGYYEQLSASGSTGTRTITLSGGASAGNRTEGTLAIATASTLIETVGMIPI